MKLNLLFEIIPFQDRVWFQIKSVSTYDRFLTQTAAEFCMEMKIVL